MKRDFPLGPRGSFPVRFAPLTESQCRALSEIPGTEWRGKAINTTWDASPIVAAELGIQAPHPPIIPATHFPSPHAREFPGFAQYLAKGYRDRLRPYQKEDATWLGRLAYAIHQGPMRSGKTRTVTAACTLIGAERVLIIGPAIARQGWTKEIDTCESEPTLILYGRGADEAELHRKGERLVSYRVLEMQPSEVKVFGYGKRSRACPLPARYACRMHANVSWSPGYCDECRRALHDALAKSRWVFVNYEILTSQKESDFSGRQFEREDLQGWTADLAALKWDVGVLDEGQAVRGVKQGFKIKGEARRDRIKQILASTPVVWETTGTPMMGRARDLWSQLDIISGGTWGHSWDPEKKIRKHTHFKFDARYCGGGHNGYKGAWTTGEETHTDELKQRLTFIRRARKRSEILPFLPPKTREVVRIDPDEPVVHIAKGPNETKTTRALRATLKIKIPHVVDHVLAECAEGSKCLVLTDRKESCEDVYEAFRKAAKKRSDLPHFQLWLGDGRVTVDTRVAMAEAFSKHRGCAVFCSNVTALPGGLSLYSSEPDFPSTSVHFVEWHHTPEAMAQAEDRMNDPDKKGGQGLAIVYYEVTGSIDEHLGAILAPKVEAVAKLMETESSTEMVAILRPSEEVLEEAWTKYLATVNLEQAMEGEDD